MEASMNRIPKPRYTNGVREEAVNLARAVGASKAFGRVSILLKTLTNSVCKRRLKDVVDADVMVMRER